VNPWHGLVEPASVVGGFATGVAAGIALIALVPGILQILSGLRANREAGALQAHRDYLRLCFDNPTFSSSEIFKKTYPGIELDKIAKSLTAESEKYLWFISVLLNTCEQITTFVSSKDEWRAVAVAQLSYHAEVLQIIWPDWQSHYTDPMNSLVRDAFAKAEEDEQKDK